MAGAYTVTASIAGASAPATFSLTNYPGPLDHIVLSPANATISVGGSQAYTALGFDAYGNSLGDVTGATTFSIAPDGSCSGASCRATVVGPHNVTGTDGSKMANATLTVDQAPGITSAATITFVKGKPGTFNVRASGYPTTMTFTKTGTLPGGVTLTRAGVLSGTPTATGTYTVTITAANSVLPNAKQTFTLKVVAIKITTLTLGTAKKGTPYSLQLTEHGGVAPFTWSNTTPKLPAGLTLSSAGKVTGTVKATVANGTYSVGISVHDNASPTHNTATVVLKIVVT